MITITSMKEITKRAIKSLKENNFEVYYVERTKGIHSILDKLIIDKETTSFGGSVTLFETGVMDYLHNRNINLLDRNIKGLSSDKINKVFRDSFSADSYLTSSNAITSNGYLYNVDGNGNRVAAMIYGPKQVIIICGTNKIVIDENEAIKRNREIAAPLNAKRLKRNTPCAKLGYCTDCRSKDRICMSYVTIRNSVTKGRIKVILIEGDYGY